jgi:hypothetical protein
MRPNRELQHENARTHPVMPAGQACSLISPAEQCWSLVPQVRKRVQPLGLFRLEDGKVIGVADEDSAEEAHS